ncbi:hypothetical protein JAAARDRAFT_63300 [Jaapia argillacea MUCL 33604]|uniref:Uncharacterized protein n=1 Tax=Jaapia argillacea MUCL 33604 TaxID=933084 RepID=A0A067P8U2_9AGAM|nr:hypothetical protein JAAARDRAFT_63300 [Jaapia argillacea MUCL 33604]
MPQLESNDAKRVIAGAVGEDKEMRIRIEEFGVGDSRGESSEASTEPPSEEALDQTPQSPSCRPPSANIGQPIVVPQPHIELSTSTKTRSFLGASTGDESPRRSSPPPSFQPLSVPPAHHKRRTKANASLRVDRGEGDATSSGEADENETRAEYLGVHVLLSEDAWKRKTLGQNSIFPLI